VSAGNFPIQEGGARGEGVNLFQEGKGEKVETYMKSDSEY
jgi:hypothetical protein